MELRSRLEKLVEHFANLFRALEIGEVADDIIRSCSTSPAHLLRRSCLSSR
jgi:hypothetical protein